MPKALNLSQQEFVSRAGSSSVGRARKTAKKLSEADIVPKIMLFGPWNTGKTYALIGLLKLGYKILVVSTELGENGLSTIKLALLRENLAHLLDNIYFLDITGGDGQIAFKEMEDFLREPEAFFPDIYDFDPDFLVWEGFSVFQGSDVSEYVGENINIKEKEGRSDELRRDGYQFETLDWNAIKNATIRPLKNFLALRNLKTGRSWFKIVTCHESFRPKPKGNADPSSGSRWIEEKKPLLSGQGGIISGAGFDLIIRCSVEGEDDDEKQYWYHLGASENTAAKNRGWVVRDKEPADMAELWKKVAAQAGLRLPGQAEEKAA